MCLSNYSRKHVGADPLGAFAERMYHTVAVPRRILDIFEQAHEQSAQPMNGYA